MWDWIDDFVHLRDVRLYWRIYVSVAAGFFFVFVWSKLFPNEKPSVGGIVCCLVIPGVLGAFWHCASNRE